MTSPIDRGLVVATGAAAGIGEAMARPIAPRARAVARVARRAARLHGRAEAHSDEAGPQAVRARAAGMSAHHGGVSVLIHPAERGHARFAVCGFKTFMGSRRRRAAPTAG